ncbi:hypothetical protein CEXT_250651, partial [Caerostris extrusa]
DLFSEMNCCRFLLNIPPNHELETLFASLQPKP